MIRITETNFLEPIEDMFDFAEEFDVIHDDIMEEVHGEIEPHAIDELETEAPPVKYPIEWASEKQRRAYWATNGFGGGIPTRRTHKIRKSWRFTVVAKGDGKAFVFENPHKASKYLYGSLAQNRSAALRFQQPFHRNTGWQPATDTVAFWLDAAHELYIEKLDKRLAHLATSTSKRRAYTKGTRRR